MTTGQLIRAARKRSGMTQAALAEKLGISYVGVSQWENDLRKPKLETLQRIANALGIPVQDLVSDWDTISTEEAIDLLVYGGQISRVAGNMQQLTATARDKVEEYSKDMLRIPENRLENALRPSQALSPAPEGKDTTPGQKPSEGPPEGGDGEL